jgi:hypothetical protein
MLFVELSNVSDFENKVVFYVAILIKFDSYLCIRNLIIFKHMRSQHFTLLHLKLRWLNLEVYELLAIKLRPIITAGLLLKFLVLFQLLHSL